MKKAFTLVELLGVIIVLLVISLITFPLISNKIKEANEKLDEATQNIVFASAKKYIEDTDSKLYNGEVYCVTIKELIVSSKLDENLVGNLDKNAFVEIKVGDEELNTNLVDSCSGVTLSNDKPPQINGIKDTEVLQWHKFDAKDGVTVTDNEDGVIPLNKLDVVGAETVTTTQVGTYTVTYSVTDSYGNTTTRQRKITVIPSEYVDNSHASAPNLKGDLIPVTIADNGTVNKADVTSRWYDYDEKKWANAVILDDDIIPDVSGNKNHGYLQNSPIRNESSITTNGSDSYVYAGLPNHELKNEFSIAIRVNVKRVVTNDDQDMFENIDAGGTALAVTKTSNFKFELYSKSKKTYIALTDTNVINLNEWYTVVGTFKDNMMHLYVNGKEVSNGLSFSASDIGNTATSFVIGGNPGNCDTTNHTCPIAEAANIEFSDALIFDRALSTDEIASEFSGKITNISNTSKMILRYELDDPIPNNTVLPEEVIESYFVWIPKFKYQLWDLGDYSSLGTTKTNKEQEIKIAFDVKDTGNIDGKECGATNKSGDIGNCTVGEWMTHPAFTSLGVNGIWVGKFETGYKGANNKTTAQVDTNESQKIIIKPNVYGWRGIKVKNIFEASYNYERDLDSHMLKNTEWGAVAYLSHSKYGIKKEIGKNNNSNHLTGCGDTVTSAASTSCNNYTTTLGMQASTTGNIYGIYDLVGGSSEYIAGYLNGNYGVSGFDATSINNYNQYFDVYKNDSDSRNDYTGRILGDCTGEMGPFFNDFRMSWYDDQAHFIQSAGSWMFRGGHYNDTIQAGQFKFACTDGGAKPDDGGFRIALAPK